MRPMCPKDWTAVPIAPGRYANAQPLVGFQRVDGLGGNPLHPTYGDTQFEATLQGTHSALRARYPGTRIGRYTIRMPYWSGQSVPIPGDYVLVDAPERLSTTSITVVTVPQRNIHTASTGFFFRGDTLPTLRERMRATPFRGIAGNLGYYYTADLLGHKHQWSHNRRYAQFPLPPMPSYLGFHMTRDPDTDEMRASFGGAHPAAVGTRQDGCIDILPRLDIGGYRVRMAGQELAVDMVDSVRVAGGQHASQHEIALFTPACRTAQTKALIAELEATGGRSERWQTYAPQIPLDDIPERVNVFIANTGDGQVPVERIAAVWEGPAPLPSFGGVLSFRRDCFISRYGAPASFAKTYLGQQVHVTPIGGTPFQEYRQILGGFVPVVVDGQHVCRAPTVTETLKRLGEYGNATSPIAEAGRESRNFGPYIREPAGVLIATRDEIGWVLFDGRHELSIGASVVDVAQLLYKLERAGAFGQAVEQAVFVDGGSALKVYHVESNGRRVRLDLLNRVAAGSRNGPGCDPDGLNLYSSLSLHL